MTEVNSKKNPTLRDVAQLAGVHQSTASRVLSGARAVSPDIARAVHRAARQLDYQVNHFGRALRGQTSGTIGMVVPDIVNPFFPSLVQAVERSLHNNDISLFLCDADNNPEVEAQRVRALLQRRVDGIIISPVHRHESAAIVREAAEHIPVVQVDRSVDAPTDIVAVDQAQIVDMIIDHLEASGRNEFAFITSDEMISTAAERLTEYQRRMADRASSRDRVFVGELSLESGNAAVSQILDDGGPLPDALICVNDLIGLGAMQRLRKAGVRIPDDIAVTGVDDTPFGRVAEPELTTVRQPVDQVGDEAVSLLLARRHEPDRIPRRIVFTGELLVRRSSSNADT